MAIDDHHADPLLPLELQCVILQMALENHMSDAKNLLFVTKYAFDWLIPILYKVVRLDIVHRIAWPPLPLPIAKLPQYGTYVQHLFARFVREGVLDQYLRYCPNITNFWIRDTLSQFQMERLVRLPLRQLRLNHRVAKTIPLTPSTLTLFSTITHLNTTQLDITFLSRFPSLTHLIVEGDIHSGFFGEISRQHPGLKVLIVHILILGSGVFPQLDRELGPGLDPRVVHLNYSITDSWQMNALGDPRNAWSFAEKVVEERLARCQELA